MNTQTYDYSQVFSKLNAIDCSEHIEHKGNLSYLSWAWAWAKVKTNFPEATFRVYEDKDGCLYHTDNKTCWVKTGVTIQGVELIEMLPIMDYRNKSIPADKVTSMDANTAIQRSLTKACARHGLGLYIYAGEDLPEAETQDIMQQATQALQQATSRPEFDAACQTYKQYLVGKQRNQKLFDLAQQIATKYPKQL